jgi:hypothetical protein
MFLGNIQDDPPSLNGKVPGRDNVDQNPLLAGRKPRLDPLDAPAIRFSNDCGMARVTFIAQWRFEGPTGVTVVPKRKIFACTRTGDKWDCKLPRTIRVTF